MRINKYLTKKTVCVITSLILLLFGILFANNNQKQNIVSAASADDFVFTWQAKSNNQELIIPVVSTSSYNYNYIVDWGDGVTNSYNSNSQTPIHNYNNSGNYDIRIIGRWPGMNYNSAPNSTSLSDIKEDAKNIVELKQWGSNEFMFMDSMFSGAENMICSTTDNPNTINVKSFYSMFKNAKKFNCPLSFDTSNVNNMANMFKGAATFNSKINFTDTSKVERMDAMFYNAKAFNQAVDFNTSKVTNMTGMFSNANSFNHPVEFDTTNVTLMTNMFYLATNFNQPVNFNTSKVINMQNMFNSAKAFNQPINFDVQNVVLMNGMFSNTDNFDQPIDFANSNKLIDASLMFAKTKVFNSPVNLNTSNVTTFYYMFDSAEKFNQPVDFDTSSATSFHQMFGNTKAFNQPINFNSDNVATMWAMFYNNPVFDSPVKFTSVAKVKNMGMMFYNTPFNQPLEWGEYPNQIDLSSLETTKNMFNSAKKFNQPINFKADNLITACSMFNGAVEFNKPFVLSNTKKLKSISAIFTSAKKFNQPINLDGDSLENLEGAFLWATNFNKPINLNNAHSITNMSNMLNGTAFNQPFNIDTSKVVNMYATFYNTNMSHDISHLDFSSVNNLLEFVSFSKLSTKNYDKLLKKIHNQVNLDNVGWKGNNLTYCLAEPEHDDFVNNHNWAMADTKDCSEYNMPPTGVVLDNNSINENNQKGDVIGGLTVTETDVNPDTNTLDFDCATPGINDNLFSINSNTNLVFNEVANYETKNKYKICIRATDSLGQTFDQNLTININDLNEAPTISGAPDAEVDQDQTYNFTPTATDPDSTSPFNTLTYSITNKPSWATFDTTTGKLSGTPNNSDVGVYNNIVITVTDESGLSASLPTFTITVNNINDAPVITSTPNWVATEDESYSYTIAYHDIDAGDVLTVTTPNLPSWLKYDAKTKTLSGTPTNDDTGFVDITIIVNDGTVSVEQKFELEINTVNDAPEITSNPSLAATQDKEYAYKLTVEDVDNSSDEVAIKVDQMPSWLTYDSNTQTFSGTPNNSHVNSTYTVTVTASDGELTDVQTFDITVTDKNDAPIINDQSFTIAENSDNNTVVGNIEASDIDQGQTLIGTIISGNDLNIFKIENGQLSVKDNTNLDYEAHQEVAIRVRVTDNGQPSLSAEANITISITDVDDEAPVITLNGDQEITIDLTDTYSELGATCVDNEDSNCQVSVSGSVNQTEGDYTITYTATDQAGNTAKITRTVKVRDLTPPIILGVKDIDIKTNQGLDVLKNIIAKDNKNKDITDKIQYTIMPNLDFANLKPGKYTINYTVDDYNGTSVIKSAFINVTKSKTSIENLLIPNTGAEENIDEIGFSLSVLIITLITLIIKPKKRTFKR